MSNFIWLTIVISLKFKKFLGQSGPEWCNYHCEQFITTTYIYMLMNKRLPLFSFIWWKAICGRIPRKCLRLTCCRSAFFHIHTSALIRAGYLLFGEFSSRSTRRGIKKISRERLRLAIKGDEANNNCVEVGCALSNAASCASWDAKRVEFQLIGCPCKELN